eukprot:3857380-Amphidinium_carterae.2
MNPALVSRPGYTVCTDGSGRHSSNPRRCGVGYYTNTGESVWLPLPGLKQSVYRAELLATVRALEECKPRRLVSDCKGVVSCLHALLAGRRQPKGRHRDLEGRALDAFPAGSKGRVQYSDLRGNRMADVAANNGTREHVPFESSDEWKNWGHVCQAVRNF